MDSSDEETRRRRSTDCIYFLASPLTCKKGSDCEYRHSDAARMNPRDCWYWFNGNCANPKCSFRHPPLDSLHGAPTTPRAPQQSAPQVSVPAQAHGSATSGGAPKQGVPCYYFQKGMCAKGDRCTFMHVPHPAGNPSAPQPQPVGKVLAPNPQLKNSWTKSNSSPQQNMPPGVLDRSKVSAHDVKPAQKQNLTSRVDHSSRIYQNHSSSYLQSGAAKHYQPQPLVGDDLDENGMEVGEFVREASAGSGVLVSGADDGTEQTFKGIYHCTNGTGMTRQAHGGYESEKSFRSSAERLSSEKKIPQREPLPVTAGSLDLRHRLLKQRRLNNSSSSSSQAPDRHGAYLDDERNGHHRWQGEEQAAHDGLSRSRLRDRIRLPGETSFDRLGSRSEKEKDRGPRSARLSPPKHTDLRGKLHERLKARSAEDVLPGDAKGLVAKASGGEGAGSLNFAGPKSLAELKAKKVVGSSREGAVRSIGSSRMIAEVVSSRESFEDPAPFEGPKPLSVILKRKREVASSETVARPEIMWEEKEDNDDAVGVEEAAQDDTVAESMEGNGEEEEEEAFRPEDDVAYDDYNVSPVADDAAGEEQQEVGGAAEDESAGQEQQDAEAAAEDEEYEYEAADMNGEEDNEYQAYHEEDDDLEEDEDEDDFARKVGVMI